MGQHNDKPMIKLIIIKLIKNILTMYWKSH